MTLEQSIEETEKSIISDLKAKKTGIDDKTGKGTATERIVQKKLLNPFLPPWFGCIKGSVVTSQAADRQSVAIDRVIYDRRASNFLVYDEDHAVLPLEAVAGIVEITMNLDKSKLRNDIRHMAPLKEMVRRRFVVPVDGTTTEVEFQEYDTISLRSYVIGLPDDSNWSPKTIAHALRDIQRGLGPPTHVHGLYVLGIGFFVTIPIERGTKQKYSIEMWTGPDRLFRFTNSLRQAFDRWELSKPGWSADLSGYVAGEPEIIDD